MKQMMIAPLRIPNQTKLKMNNMGNILYTIAVLLLIAWAIGFIGYNAGAIIHILLVIAIIAVILKIIQGPRKYNNN